MSGEDYKMRTFMICTPHQTLCGCSNQGGTCGTYFGTGEVDAGFWWGDPREKDYLKDLGVRWEDDIKKGSSRSGMVRHGLD